MSKLQAEIARLAAERGRQGAGKLVDTILTNLGKVASSDRLTKTDAEYIMDLRSLMKANLTPLIETSYLFDPQTASAGAIGSTVLWHIIGLCYRAGQVTANARIAEDVLGPEIARKADSKKGPRGGKVSAVKRKPETDAKQAKVLLIMDRIKGKMPTISKRNLATKIRENLPKKMKLRNTRIQEIIRASESGQSTG